MELKDFKEIDSIGIDVGSFSTKVVGISKKGHLSFYKKQHWGKPELLINDLKVLKIRKTAISKEPLSIYKRVYDPITCLCKAVRQEHPETNHIIHLGANDLILVTLDNMGNILRINNNSLCASTTGSFLDVQAKRMGINIYDLKKTDTISSPPKISTRCAVFAKSDLIFKQQEGSTVTELWSGLCRGLAENVLNTLIGGKNFKGNIALSGGVALNTTFVYWLRNCINVRFPECILQILSKPDYSVALGAALSVYHNVPPDTYFLKKSTQKKIPEKRPIIKIKKSSNLNSTRRTFVKDEDDNEITSYKLPEISKGKIQTFLGLDIGSISTKLVLVDREGNIFLDIYRPTGGNPILATGKLFHSIISFIQQHNLKIEIIGAATTGSGRKLIGEIIGADIIINEVSAHCKSAVRIFPDVETIFEIGGQDSKFMRVRKGKIIDMNMNYGCAAGTGAFLEELSDKLGYSVEDLGYVVMGTTPPYTSSRCTVFMEQDIYAFLNNDFSRKEVAGAVLYSICENYLQRVVGLRHINKKSIVFQGATARNPGLVAAFENILNTNIQVSPFCHIMGAWGAALYAIENRKQKSSFRGFAITQKQINVEHKCCSLCKNNCLISNIRIEGEKENFIYGMKCGREENHNYRQMLSEYSHYQTVQELFRPLSSPDIEYKPQPVIGLPLTLTTYSMSIFWQFFFDELGLKVEWGTQANQNFIDLGNKYLNSDMCLPVKASCGFVLSQLKDKQIDAVFFPHMLADNAVSGLSHSRFCPYICVLPSLLKIKSHNLISPVIDFQVSDHINSKAIINAFATQINLSISKVMKAFSCARKARVKFKNRLDNLGNKLLMNMKPSKKPAIVIIGQPYIILDDELNKGIPFLIAGLGFDVIPIQCMPWKPDLLKSDFQNLFWSNGQLIVNALLHVARNKGLYAIYLSSHGCGPDSVLLTYAETIMGDKPFLAIELGEHGSFGGYQTRVEAFLDVVKSDWSEKKYTNISRQPKGQGSLIRDYKKRTIWIPPMHIVGKRLLAAAFRSAGYDAQPLPAENLETFNMGKKCTRGTECLPTPLVLGTFLNQIRKEEAYGKDPNKFSALFLPTSQGPCRFGQYRTLDRIILDRLGYTDLPIFSTDVTEGYNDLNTKLKLKFWEAIIISDILYQMRCKIKPYELTSGDTEEILQHRIAQAESLIESGQCNWRNYLKKTIIEFNKISTRKKTAPLVVIVGEIYLRFNTFGNNNLVELIESLGGEVWISPISEWILYTIWIKKFINKLKNCSLKVHFHDSINWYYMLYKRNQLFRFAKPILDQRKNPSIHDILEKGSKLVPLQFEGESIVTLGRTMFLKPNDIDLIINCKSLGCMHGNITTTLIEQYGEQIGIPIINSEFDGLEDSKNLSIFMNEAIRNRELRVRF